MLVISTREFRANQGKYLGMAASGEEIVLKSRNNGSFRLVPVEPPPYTMEEIGRILDQSEADHQEGRTFTTAEAERILRQEHPWLCK